MLQKKAVALVVVTLLVAAAAGCGGDGAVPGPDASPADVAADRQRADDGRPDVAPDSAPDGAPDAPVDVTSVDGQRDVTAEPPPPDITCPAGRLLEGTSCVSCTHRRDDAACAAQYGPGHICDEGSCVEGECHSVSDCSGTACQDHRCQGSGLSALDVQMEPFGAPLWTPVGFQQFSANLGSATTFTPPELIATEESVLPAHVFFGNEGVVGPRTAHAPPYDGELAAGVTAAGLVNNDRFTLDDITAPQGILLMFLIVPGQGAPNGSSTDYSDGPIIANADFPVAADGDLHYLGGLVDPAFDSNYPGPTGLSPPFSVDGASHWVFAFGETTAYIPRRRGPYQWRITLTDASGSGWRIATRFVIEGPGGCDDDEPCPSTRICRYEANPPPGACPALQSCTTDADCFEPGTICDDQPPRGLEACPLGGFFCVKGCSFDGDCREGEECGADSRCQGRDCSQASCPDHFQCQTDAGDGSMRCQRQGCTSGSDCADGGFCLGGRCHAERGECLAP
jgi:hypothetical protein